MRNVVEVITVIVMDNVRFAQKLVLNVRPNFNVQLVWKGMYYLKDCVKKPVLFHVTVVIMDIALSVMQDILFRTESVKQMFLAMIKALVRFVQENTLFEITIVLLVRLPTVFNVDNQMHQSALTVKKDIF